MLTVGDLRVAVDDARAWVSEYLTSEPGLWAYPSYDGYATNGDPDRLCDGDLLAPVLLNVQMSIRAFAGLRACRRELEQVLADVPTNFDIIDADDDAIARVGALYAVLDSDSRPWGIGGTTLAKILHRKKPRIIPVFDENVSTVYQQPGGPLAPDPNRSWVEFMTELAKRMRDDLNRSLAAWDDLTTLAPADRPPVSRLRALDIVAWNRGSPNRESSGAVT
jgi:hypothetical protein